MRDQVIWLDRGLLPIYFGFCPSERAWKREAKRMNVKDAGPYPTSDGRCTTFEDSDGHISCIVTVNEGKKRATATLHGILVHEGMHVWQKALEAMGEKRPSIEFEAYACQHIFLELCRAYEKARRIRPKKKPVTTRRRTKAKRH